jgi:alkylation response protein AidB-like acyl-CoA dehydrogenase
MGVLSLEMGLANGINAGTMNFGRLPTAGAEKAVPDSPLFGYNRGAMDDGILREARRLADEVFRPRAEATDQGGIDGPIRENVRLLANAGYYGLGIPPEFGGLGADDATRREFTELMASACGATAFTQQQLHAGGGFVGGSSDEDLKRELLPKFASGELLCGIAFSHLRRKGPPMVRATRTDGGYVINGEAPWVTGWGIVDAIALGAAVDGTGDHLFAYVPKTTPEDGITATPALPLAAMAASDTVEVAFNNVIVPDRYILYIRPAESLRRADFCGITGHAVFPLGCARGSVHYLRALAAQRGSSHLETVANAFEREIAACRKETLIWTGACVDLPDYKEHALRARSEAIVLATRAAHAAVAATGGSAHLLHNAPQRLMREAVFYTTLAQTADVQAGTLDLLISPECWREL